MQPSVHGNNERVVLLKNIKTLAYNLMGLKNIYTKRSIINNPPTYIWLEPTNQCNLRCIMCPNGRGKVKIEKGYMKFILYKRIIDQIKDYASTVTLAVNGESLLHQNIIDMVKYADLNGIKVNLNTNATLLSKEVAGSLLDSGISYINFAVDGFNKKMYEKARLGADFEKTLNNISYFLRLKKTANQKKPYTVISILELNVEEYSEEEKQKFIARYYGLIDELRLREAASWGKTFKDSADFNYKKHDGTFLPCSRLWSTACISWNGRVLPCIYTTNHEYILGDINEKPLMDIWNDLPMEKLRRAMLENRHLEILSLCENCIVTGTAPIMGIPSGLRLTISDAIANFLGSGFEKHALSIANFLRDGKFTSRTIRK